MRRIFLLFIPVSLYAQQARLHFEVDTLAIGRPATVKLEIIHPSRMTIIFPAAEEAFAPFEYLSTAAEPTVTLNGQSRDVAIYQVSSFELDERQQLSLPWAYINDRGDTVYQKVSSNPVRLMRRSQAGTTQLKTDTASLLLQDEPDYVVLILLGFGLLSIIGVAGALIRKPVMRWYARRHVRARWKDIQKRWQELESKLDQPAAFLEKLSHIWKEYLDLGVRAPLRSFTTTELERILQRQPTLSDVHRQALLNSSQWADEVIYAGKPAPERLVLKQLHAHIGEVIEQAYLHKRDLIQG